MTRELRRRTAGAAMVALCVALGLATRALPWLPAFVRDHAGDALWAAMVFWGIATVFPRWRTGVVAAAALGFSIAIECSQLSSHPVLVEARSTRLGALVLGHGFLWIDLVRYAAGVAAAALVDLLAFRRAAAGSGLPAAGQAE